MKEVLKTSGITIPKHKVMAKEKKKLTPEQRQELEEREVYLSCLFIDESARCASPNYDMSFGDLFVSCCLA